MSQFVQPTIVRPLAYQKPLVGAYKICWCICVRSMIKQAYIWHKMISLGYIENALFHIQLNCPVLQHKFNLHF